MLQKIYISDKCCSSELSVHQRNLKKILLSCFQHNNNKVIVNVFWAANQNIWMISEGSCDWSNWCWKFSFEITGINDYLKHSNRKQLF